MYLQLVSRVVDDLHSRLFISSGPPTVPTLSCVDLSEDISGAVNVTVSWTLSGGDSADFYLMSITTNAPQTPYGGLLNITTASITQHELTGFMTGYEYNITVHGVTANCGGLVGKESEPLTIRPQSKLIIVPENSLGVQCVVRFSWFMLFAVTLLLYPCSYQADDLHASLVHFFRSPLCRYSFLC